MWDLKLAFNCDHRVYDEMLTVDGSTPNYTATLNFPYNGAKSKVVVREFSEAESISSFRPRRDGVTDFVFLTDQVIQFNSYLGQPGVRHLEGDPDVVPLPYYVADYYTKLDDCPKCLGEGFMSDVDFDALGELKEVKGRDLIKQRVVKAILTLKGSNDLAQQYGSNLGGSIGRSNLGFLMLGIQQSVFDAVNRLVRIQSENLEFMPVDEILLGIQSLNMQPTDDPRELKMQLTILSGTYEEIKVSMGVRV